MTYKKINYKIKCSKCGTHFNREEIINNYGRQTCKNCLRYQIIPKTHNIYIPTFILTEAGIKANDKIHIKNTTKEIIITKNKK